MLVDDEVDLTNILKKGLQAHGYTVDAFNNAEDALKVYKSNHYDRVFLDIRMPEMSGFELAHLIWQLDNQARVCFLSSFEIFQDEADKVFKDLNTRCFLKKPITTKELIAHIEKHELNA